MKEVKDFIHYNFKNNKSLLVLTLISLLFFLYGLSNMFLEEITVYLKYLFYYFLPLLLFIILLILSFKKIISQKFTKIITILGYLTLWFYMLFIILMHVLHLSLEGTTDIRNYKILFKGASSELKEYLPSTLPEEKENVMFYYSPAFLQKGETFSLYFKSNSEFIKDQEEKLEEISTVKYQDIDIDLTHTPYDRLDKEFTIYLINSHCSDEEYCNHGNYFVIAINKEQKEILYVIENW